MMNNEQGGNLVINGSGSASGGLYAEVKINGSGRVNGDIQCRGFHANGSSTVEGSLQAELCKVSGSTRIEGGLQADKLVVSGSMKAAGGFRGKDARVDGDAKFAGPVAAEKVVVHGGMKVEGNLEAEEFRCRGNFHVEGLLNAETVDVVLAGSSEAREIGGGLIRVKRPLLANSIGKFVKGLLGVEDHLTTDIIEGDELELEATRARIVRGNRITIGPDCEIGLLEYKSELNRNPNSKINEERKM